MNTAVINVKVEPKTKKQAQEVAKSLGLSLSAILNAYLKQLVRTRSVAYDDVRLTLTPQAEKWLAESEEDVKAGRITSYSPDEALTYLDTLIAQNENHTTR